MEEEKTTEKSGQAPGTPTPPKRTEEENGAHKRKASRWVVGLGLLFMLGLFALSLTPYGLAVWLGRQDETEDMRARIAQAPLHREVGPLARVFRLPGTPHTTHWREVSMKRPLKGATSEDKALWAAVCYKEADFELLEAQLLGQRRAHTRFFLEWFVADIEQNMKLSFSEETKICFEEAEACVEQGPLCAAKAEPYGETYGETYGEGCFVERALCAAQAELWAAPAHPFMAEGVPAGTSKAYIIPSKRCILLTRFGAEAFIAP